jgi:hypothetical protein
MIKSKPDIKIFNKDPNDFLEGGEADKALSKPRSAQERTSIDDTMAYAIEAFKPEPTVQKLFRLRWDIANALKLGAAQESAKTGKRVTETEIIQQLLKAHYNLK